MTKDELLKRLDTMCEKAGSMRKFALDNGFSAGYVSQVVNGKSPPSKRLLKAIGINEKVSYVKIPPDYRN